MGLFYYNKMFESVIAEPKIIKKKINIGNNS